MPEQHPRQIFTGKTPLNRDIGKVSLLLSLMNGTSSLYKGIILAACCFEHFGFMFHPKLLEWEPESNVVDSWMRAKQSMLARAVEIFSVRVSQAVCL